MEIISYISTVDGFTHYILSPSMGVPFFLWCLLLCSCVSLIYLVLSKILGN